MNLKQKLAVGLCAFYLFSVIGVALSLHFCGGKLASVAVNTSKTACNLCLEEPATKKDDGCCKNTKVEVKVTDSHQIAATLQLQKLFTSDLFLPQSSFVFVKINTLKAINLFVNKSPPRSQNIALHIINCVFRN